MAYGIARRWIGLFFLQTYPLVFVFALSHEWRNVRMRAPDDH